MKFRVDNAWMTSSSGCISEKNVAILILKLLKNKLEILILSSLDYIIIGLIINKQYHWVQ